MALEENDSVMDQDLDDSSSSQTQYDDEDLENDDVVAAEEEDEFEEEEDLNSVSPSISSPVLAVPLGVPSSSAVTVAVPNGVDPPSSTTLSLLPNPNQHQTATPLVISQDDNRKPQQTDKSRQLFQRLWTDEDEIELLQGFLDYITQRGGGNNNHHDTAAFYDQIKSKLQLDFNKNQLVEKLRRLKKKYRNVIDKINSGKDFSFKSAHDQATFEISRKIWSSTGKIIDNFEDEEGNPNINHNLNLNLNESDVKSTPPKSRKRPRSKSAITVAAAAAAGGGGGGARVDEMRDGFIGNNNDNNNSNSNVGNNNNINVSSLIEETVKSCLSPLFKELLSNGMVSGGASSGTGIAGLAMNALPLNFGGGEMMMNEKWRKQQIMELELYSKRLELVQDQIRAQLEELRSMGR